MISWFARNPVAANLLMAVILLAGFATAMDLRTEGFPSLPPKAVTITVVNDSGSSKANEEGIALKIEEALRGLVGVKRITSTSTPSMTTVRVEKTSSQSLQVLAENVRSKVSGVALPTRAERPVYDVESLKELVASIQVTGDVDMDVLDEVAKRVRTRLQADPVIPLVTTGGMRTPEINITVKEGVLQAYGLTLKEVADRVGEFSSSNGNGELKGNGNSITVKANHQAYFRRDFEQIEIVSQKDGGKIYLSELATISDGFAEREVISRFQGKPSIGLYIQMIGKADLVPAAKRAREILKEIKAENQLPNAVELDMWNDASGYIADRLSLMMKNALIGVGLVFLFLALFLNIRVAFWVAMGLPVAFAGSFILMGDMFKGLSINELTTFGFIIALGIVVDDAVVIGESVYSARVRALKQKGVDRITATLNGVHQVAHSTIFGVLTTVAAFFPITLIKGEMAEIFAVFAWVVVFALIFSIIESKLILPAHLATITMGDETKNPSRLGSIWGAIQKVFSDLMLKMKEAIYLPTLKKMAAFRYASLFGFIGIFIFVIGLVPSGQIRMVFFPEIPSDTIVVSYSGVTGLNSKTFFKEADRIEEAARALDDELQQENKGQGALIVRLETIATQGGEAIITAELAPRSTRTVTTNEIARRWKEKVGSVEGVDKLDFASSWEGEEDLRIELISSDQDQLKTASEHLVHHLAGFEGVSDLRNSVKEGRPRLQLELRDLGKSLGLTSNGVATQLFGGLSGFEVQRIQRGSDEIKVRVRLPQNERSDVSALEDLQIRTPAGDVVALIDVARIIPDIAANSITRVNHQRVGVVTADTDKALTSGAEIVDELQKGFFKTLKTNNPGLTLKIGGEVQEEAAAIQGFMMAFAIALVSIYVLLAVPLKSYIQPVVIMSAIPFGVTGALLGHWINDVPLSILSINGILALCGVVVNDSLLLVTAYNKNRKKHMSVRHALLKAGSSRFRAVMLTSITTFVGLAPLILETSEQAQILIPAAISLGYGILFATAITLILVPVLVYIVEDFSKLVTKRLPTDRLVSAVS